MTVSEGTQLLTAATGLVGVIGGVVISYLSLRHSTRGDRHSVGIAIRPGIILTDQGIGKKMKSSDEKLIFDVVNNGVKDFTAVQVGLQVGRRKGLVAMMPEGSVNLPHVLHTDDTCSLWLDHAAIKSELVKSRPPLRNKAKIKGYVRDYAGHTFWSKRMTVVLRETWHYKFGQLVKRGADSVIAFLLP